MMAADVPNLAVCVARAATFYRADRGAVAAHVVARGGRSGEIRTLPNGEIEIGLARIPGNEAKALAASGITEAMLANDDCLNVAIATYLMRRDAPATPSIVPVVATVRPPASGQGGCMGTAAKRYHLDTSILRAVVKTEGGWDGLRKRNTNGSYDLGVAQINTIHLAELAKYGISERQLISDACVNVHVAAYRLRFEINRVGDLWRGVGNYHSRTPSLSRRYEGKVRVNLQHVLAGVR